MSSVGDTSPQRCRGGLLGHVALEEPIHHAYSQTWFESPNLRPGELPYLLAVGAGISRHFYEDLAVMAFGQGLLRQGENPRPKRALRFPGFRSAHVLVFPSLLRLLARLRLSDLGPLGFLMPLPFPDAHAQAE
jgi:hypothetical protein